MATGWQFGPLLPAQVRPFAGVESGIDRVMTQYRESAKLLAMIREYLGQVTEATRVIDGLIAWFDIDSATSDQLTILGNALGWPRCHCRGQRRPVFGFACDDDECGLDVLPIGGFCEADWDCGPAYIEFCFTDDELYRRFLKARIIAVRDAYDLDGVSLAAKELFGNAAAILSSRDGVIQIAAGRLLTGIEISIVHLYEQVMPIAPGVRLEVLHSKGSPFGFGDGWGQLCDGYWPVKIPLN